MSMKDLKVEDRKSLRFFWKTGNFFSYHKECLAILLTTM